MERVKRQELKYLIPYQEFLTIKKRLDKVLQKDRYSIEGSYKISSLYYDDIFNTAYRQKVDGYSERYKYRIRYYNDDYSFFKLEKKMKSESICNKESVVITHEDVENILSNNFKEFTDRREPLLLEFLSKLKSGLYAPKTMVEYQRTAFTHPVGNVRITFDQYVKGSYNNPTIGPNKNILYQAIDANYVVMEIKFNEVLPQFIKSLIQTTHVTQESISKFVLSRDLVYL